MNHQTFNLHQLKAMRDLMQTVNNEDYYTDWWLYHYPDGATEEELMEIAGDEESYTDIAKCFLSIMADINEKNCLHNFTGYTGKIHDDEVAE